MPPAPAPGHDGHDLAHDAPPGGAILVQGAAPRTEHAHPMKPGSLWPALVLALAAGASLWGGSMLPGLAARSRAAEKWLARLIGFSAGLMLATSLHDLIPHAIEMSPRATFGIAAGFLALYLAERVTHFHACRHRRCEPDDHHGHDHSHGRAHASHSHGLADSRALVGMSVHNFADGLTTAAAFGVSTAAGLTVVLAILMHQLAAGLSLGAIMMRAGRERGRALLLSLGAAACIPLGVLFTFLAVPLSGDAQGLVLGVAAGSFLYVAVCDLLPEAHAEDEGWSITAATFAGYAFTLLVRALAPHAH